MAAVKIHPFDMFVLLRGLTPYDPRPEQIGANLEVVLSPEGSYTKRNPLIRFGKTVYEETTSAPIITKEFEVVA